MIQIDDVVISLDVFREKFLCNLDACKGECCIEGDAGAPVELDEVEKFKTSVSRGVVERVSFRGDNLELQVRVNNSVVTARRSLEKADIREGETVNVFLYRIFALRGDSVQLIENEAVRDDFVII